MAERRARSAPRPPWRVQLRLHPATPLRAGEGEVPGVERAAPKQRRPPMKGDRSMTKVALYARRSEEHTSELQSLMRISYAVFCLKKKNNTTQTAKHTETIH